MNHSRKAQKRAQREVMRAFRAEAVRLANREGRRFPKFKRPEVALATMAPELA